jgi:hypothetical protein
MLRVKQIVRLAAIAALLASLHAAETPAERGKRLVNEALQALGGDAFLHMTSRVVAGRAYSFYRSEVTSLSQLRIYTRYIPAPEPGKLALRERQSFLASSGKTEESSAVLFTENGAWNLTFRGNEPLEAERYRNYIDSTENSIFYILRCRLNEPGLDFFWQSTDVFNNRPVEIVDITDAAGLTVTVSFDQDSKLPLKTVYRHRNEQFKDFDTEVAQFANYQDAGHGVKWPGLVERDRNGDKISAIYADSVEVNRVLSEDLFTLPAATIAPKKKK